MNFKTILSVFCLAFLAACSNTTNPGQGPVSPPGSSPHEDSNEMRNPDIDTAEINNRESGDRERGVGAGR